MYRTCEFVGQRRVDLALALHAVGPHESRRCDFNSEVAFTTGAGACVAGVFGAIVNDVKGRRCKRQLQLFAHHVGNSGHIRLVNP